MLRALVRMRLQPLKRNLVYTVPILEIGRRRWSEHSVSPQQRVYMLRIPLRLLPRSTSCPRIISLVSESTIRLPRGGSSNDDPLIYLRHIR
jgi:hypothetical protein